MPAPRNLTFVLAWPILLMLALQPRADDGKDSASVQPIEGVVAEIDRINLEKNLRWIVQRERTRLAGQNCAGQHLQRNGRHF